MTSTVYTVAQHNGTKCQLNREQVLVQYRCGIIRDDSPIWREGLDD